MCGKLWKLRQTWREGSSVCIQALQKGLLMSIIQFLDKPHNSPIAQFSYHDPARRAPQPFLL